MWAHRGVIRAVELVAFVVPDQARVDRPAGGGWAPVEVQLPFPAGARHVVRPAIDGLGLQGVLGVGDRVACKSR